MIPTTGDIVRVRSRQYLVEGVDLPPQPGDRTLVRLGKVEKVLAVPEEVKAPTEAAKRKPGVPVKPRATKGATATLDMFAGRKRDS